MMSAARNTIRVASSVRDALALLAEGAPRSEIMAGATWIMRAPLRDEIEPRAYVAVSRISELHGVALTARELRLGSCVTHASLAQALTEAPEFAGLRTAAAKSANPQVRAVATVGGNLCTADFAAADIATALLCLDATVTIERQCGPVTVSLSDFLPLRTALRGSGLVTGLTVQRGMFRSAHTRLPLRKAGDYPVAIVSVSVERGADGTIDQPRIAVGSVEIAPKRWTALEHRLQGLPFDLAVIAEAAGELVGGFPSRDSVEAPGWYRVQVLPVLVRRAFEDLQPW